MAAGQAGFRSAPTTEEGSESAQGRPCTGREPGPSAREQETGCEFRDSRLNQIQSTGAARRNKMDSIMTGRHPQ